MTAPSKLAPSEAVREAIAFAVGTREYESPKSKVSFWEHLGGYYKGHHRSSADAALAAIAAQGLVLVPVEQWLPIETAPKDRFVLLFCPRDDSTWFASWQTDEWYGVDEEGLTRRSLLHSDALSHWMPLPNPPAAVKPPAEET